MKPMTAENWKEVTRLFQIEVVGSIRRQRTFSRDIDIVLIPSNQGVLLVAFQSPEM